MAADRRDICLARLAARQHGVVTPEQLAQAGLSRSAIRYRIEHERLHPFVGGAYLVGHRVAPPLAAETAAVLLCGPDAVLSHSSAAAIWGIEDAGASVHVTVTRAGSSGRRGVIVHRVGALDAADRRRRSGLPVTAPARTLLDLASVLGRDRLDAALERARATRLVTPADIDAAIARCPFRRGAGQLCHLLEDRPTLTRSRAERLLLDLAREGGLPAPETNARIGRYEVDVLWRSEQVVVEIDGFAFHADRRAFERDRRRDADLQAAGFRVLRFTWRRLAAEPQAVLVTLARMLPA